MKNNLIGSWTYFNRKITEKINVRKFPLEYLPTIPQPSEYLVCKKVLYDLLKVMKDLDLDYTFAQGYEKVHDGLVHIIWKDCELYTNIVILLEEMGNKCKISCSRFI